MTTLPTWDDFMAPVLRVLSDGEERRLRELRDQVAKAEGLTDEQLAAVLPTGQSTADNRIGWAASYLNRVGAVTRPARGRYLITDIGRDLLTSHPGGITEADIRLLATPGDEWWVNRGQKSSGTGSTPLKAVETISPTIDPDELIAQGFNQIHDEVAAELLKRLYEQSPVFFEQAVLDLLIAMGYGGTEGTATRTQLSNDGGIDGIVDQDALGLSRIYVQAKRYALDASVGRPEIQAFVGALHGAQASQGVFITTGRFSSGARDYAGSVASRIVLIDGRRMTDLMIRYGVGVQVKRTLQIVEVDEDFFE